MASPFDPTYPMSTKITRYDTIAHLPMGGTGVGDMEKANEGDYVKYEDHEAAIRELEARLEAMRVAAHRFKDSYGKVVRAGDTVIIEETYRNERHTGKEAVVSWDESNGVYRYLADGMFSPSDFYGVHKFKKIKP